MLTRTAGTRLAIGIAIGPAEVPSGQADWEWIVKNRRTERQTARTQQQ